MMILFFFESTWAGIKYSIVYDIFSTAGFIFDILYKLMTGGSQFAYSLSIDKLSTILYTVAGIFMLFRATIGLIQMLINPDQVNDKQVGAGKLITRIVLVIVLLILFTPGNYLIGSNGLISRMETSIIGQNGFLIKVFDELGWSKKEEENLSSKSQTNKNNLLIENVEAASSTWTKTCYYYPGLNCSQQFTEDGKTKQCKSSKNYLKVQFSNKKTSGSVPITCDGKTCKTGEGNGRKDAPISSIYVKLLTGTENVTYNKKSYKVTFVNPGLSKMNLGTEDASTVRIYGPSSSASKISNCNNWRISNSKNAQNPTSNWTIRHVKFTGVSNGGSYTFGMNDWFGTNSLKELVKVVKYSGDNLEKGVEVGGDDDTLDNQLKKAEMEKFENNASKVFVTRAMGSFENCVSSDEAENEKCESLKSDQFQKLNTDTAKDLTDAMVDGTLELDFMMGTIGGILCIVFLALLCVDVIVRQLKLWILQILAPIPIICYTDPKDKIFMQWLKMFGTVYVDLFIKLFALEVAIYLLSSGQFDILQHKVSGIGNFFLIIAILVFAKGLPAMISKIFGLDGMGSFKDIGGMLKAGAGFGAGAVIGGAVGLASGVGKNGGLGMALGGVAKGAVMGAGSGSKGNVLGGARNIASANAKEKIGKSMGLSWFDRKVAGFMGTLGMTGGDAAIANKMEKAQAVEDANKALKDYALGEVQKKGYTINGKTMSAFTHDKQGNWKGITAKDNENKIVAGGRKDVNGIDMKDEYNTLSSLEKMTADEYAGTINKITDSDGNTISNYGDALRFQQQRVVALEDYAVADKINRDNGAEMTKYVDEYNDKVEQAAGVGIAFNSITQGNVTNKTLSNNKDAAIRKRSEIAKENETAIKRNQYNSLNGK